MPMIHQAMSLSSFSRMEDLKGMGTVPLTKQLQLEKNINKMVIAFLNSYSDPTNASLIPKMSKYLTALRILLNSRQAFRELYEYEDAQLPSYLLQLMASRNSFIAFLAG